MTAELTERLAAAALDRWRAGGADWLDVEVARGVIVDELAAALTRIDDRERAARSAERCPVPGASADDHLSTLVNLAGREALLEVRFKGLDPDWAFIELRAHLGALDDALVTDAVQAASARYGVLKPRALRITTHQPEGAPGSGDAEVVDDQHIVAAPTAALVAEPPLPVGHAGEHTLSLERLKDQSGYERFKATFTGFVDGHPALKDELWLPDVQTFQGLVDIGQTYDVIIDGAWGGLIAALPEPFMGMPGWLIHEELLADHARGQGFAAPMQRALVEQLHTAAPGIVHPAGAALASAFVSAPHAPALVAQARSGGWLRLDEHVRSLCLDVGPLGGATPGTLVVKGAEPAMDDVDALLDWMAQTSFRTATNVGHRPMIEHFPLKEGKVPAALTLAEARRDAHAALGLQAQHLQQFGTLARAPIPVAVLRHDPSTTDRLRDAVSARLTPAARAIVQDKLDETRDGGGLGALVYLYPGFPVRARSFTATRAGESEADRIARMRSIDLEATIHDWASLVVRMLALELLPYSYQNEGLGACFDAGNACVDGGFVDVDSVVPMSDLRDDGEVLDAVVATRLGLIRTASLFFPLHNQGETRMALITRYVDRALDRAVAEVRRGIGLDRRVEAVFGDLSLDDTWAWLQTRQWHHKPYVG